MFSKWKRPSISRVITHIIKGIIPVGAAYIALFQLVAAYYGLQLNGAILERTSVESLIGDDKLALAVRGLGIAQKRRIPEVEPQLYAPWTWFSFNTKPEFKERLHEEIIVALKEYADELLSGKRPRLHLSHADLKEADLQEANLVYALLFEANLANANLRNANLTGAALNKANLSSANLEGARLEKARLYQSDLTNAILSRVNLSNSNMEGADLKNSILVSAIVADVNFYGANLTGSDLNGLRSWRNIKNIKNVNIKNIIINDKKQAIAFKNWALAEDQGAVEMDEEIWKIWREMNYPQPGNWSDWKAHNYSIDSKGIPVESISSKSK